MITVISLNTLLIYLILSIAFLFLIPILGRLNFISKEYYHSIILIKDFFTYKNYLFWVLIFPFNLWFISILFYLLKSTLVDNIWFVSLFFWILLFIYIKYILQRSVLLVKKHFFTTSLLSIIVTVLFNYYFFNKGLEFLLSLENWWFYVAFFYFILESITHKHQESIVNDSDKLIINYILKKRLIFQNKYKTILSDLRDFEKQILMSILIVEDYNRPPLLRYFERYLSYFNLAKTTGIAQIKEKGLSDSESVKKLKDKVVNYFKNSKELNIDEAQDFFIKINGKNYNKMVLAVLENLKYLL